MTDKANEARVRKVFDEGRKRSVLLVANFVDDGDAVVDEAAVLFEDMIPGMAYLDTPDAPMAGAVFSCNTLLALWLVLKERGVDVHVFGAAMLAGLSKRPAPKPAAPEEDSQGTPAPLEGFEALITSGEASQRGAKPGEFVYEARLGDPEAKEWSMNIKSCAICHSFGKQGAMDLVPYMCASDDVVSDLDGAGLRRTGSIALGAHQCDFVYKHGGEPQRLAELYPDKIHFHRED